MAKQVSLNSVAEMLSTKGGRMETIGGAIGCMSAMISKDAREKDGTTSNDVRKIQEFICGNGGSLQEMIDVISESILVQGATIQELIDSKKEKSLVKTDVTRMIKKATDGIEKRLDDILDSLGVIIKTQKGEVNWGKPKKIKDSVEKFKDALNSEKEMKKNRFAKVVSMLQDLKAISLKDLITAPFKLKGISKVNEKINDFVGKLKDDDIDKARRFFKNAPGLLNDVIAVTKLSRKIKEKDFNRLYTIFGVTSDQKTPNNSILGIINTFADLDEDRIKKARKTMSAIFGVVKDVCFCVSFLVLFSPIVMVGGLLVKPLEWALFGLRGNGGIVGLLKKLAEHEEDIKESLKSVAWMSLSFAALGVGLGVLFLLTRNVDLEQLVVVAATTALLAIEVSILGKFKDEIKEGSVAMLYMSAGLLGLGLGLGLLFATTKDVEWEQVGILGVSILGLGLATFVLGNLNKSGMVIEGSIAMLVMGACLIPLGISMKLLMNSVKGLKWGEIGMFGAAILGLGGAVIGLGLLMSTGVGAIAWGAGLIAIGALGVALIPLGISMKKIVSVAKNVDNKAIDRFTNAAYTLVKKLGSDISFKEVIRARRTASVLKKIGKSLGVLGNSLKKFNDTAGDSMDKAMDAVTKITEFFFSPESKLNKMNTGFFKRRKTRKTADSIGYIGKTLGKLSTSLRFFNEVSTDSIDKAMDAVTKIARFFFDESSELNKMNTGFFKRTKANKNANAIGHISGNIHRLATGLKIFNEVADTSIDKAMSAITRIAQFFFVDLEDMNTNWIKRRKAEKTSGTIGVISESIYKLGEGLKDFNNMGPGVIDTALDSIKQISDYFFNNDVNFKKSKAKAFEKTIKYFSNGIKKLKESTEDINIDNLNKSIEISKVITNDIFANWDKKYKSNADEICDSFKSFGKVFSKLDSDYENNISKTKELFDSLNTVSTSGGANTITKMNSMVEKISSIDISKTQSLTNLFKSFADIGKAGGIFSRFDKRVKQFTDACLELINAVNGNTDALNRDDEMVTVKNASGEEQVVKRSDAEFMPKQMSIVNVRDLAMAIADELNSLSVDCDASVNLMINGDGGSEWRISRM